MNKTTARHVIETDCVLIGLTGALLMVSPFLLGYPKGASMVTVDVAIGTLVMTAAASRALMGLNSRFVSVINMTLGLLALTMPWMLGTWRIEAYKDLHVAVGAVIILLAAVNLMVTVKNRPFTRAW